jgi:hypothetical protein
MIEWSVLADERIEPQQAAVQRDRYRQRVPDGRPAFQRRQMAPVVIR